MMMKKYLFTALIVAFSLLFDYTAANVKPSKLQNCLGLLRGQERYCCNYIQAHTPKKTTTITSTSTSTVPASTVTATSTALTTNTISETDTNLFTITALTPTTIFSTETDTVTSTTTVTTYSPLPQKRRRDDNNLSSEEEEALSKRGWLDAQLKIFGQEIIFNACTALLQLSHYNCPALSPITSTITASTVTTLPAITETDTITSTVDVTSKATVDVTSTITSTQTINAVTTTTSTIYATQTVTGPASDICNLSGQCGTFCYTDHDTDGKIRCIINLDAQDRSLTTCSSNSDCKPGSYCGVGSSCYFRLFKKSDPFVCITPSAYCSGSQKRENLLYDTDMRTGKILRV